MKLCSSLHCPLTIVWILAWSLVHEINAFQKRGRASHVMRGFDILPRDIQLYQPCRSSFECLLYISHSHCDWEQRVCTCQPYHVTFNNSMCLPASLLGFGCILDSQCRMKVPHSRCVDGLCECEPNHIPLRRDKCLPPAKVEDYCLNDHQCLMASRYSYCKYIIPRIYGKCKCPLGYKVTEEGQCLPHLGNECENTADCEKATPNSYCSQVNDKTGYCECKEAFAISSNKMRCEPKPLIANIDIQPISLGKSCKSSEECQARDPYSICNNGICDCIVQNDTCSARRTGCYKDSFQCRSGFCISWYFVCDKQMNCPDNSDEDECIPHNCPKEAFQCDDGTCLSRALVCNGQWECPDGSDEARCYTGIPCDRKAFRCKNGQCLPQFTFCNAVQDCADGSDEIEEVCDFGNGGTCPKKSFQCNNSRCRSTAILCSGLDGCGDNSDETRCEVCYCKKP